MGVVSIKLKPFILFFSFIVSYSSFFYYCLYFVRFDSTCVGCDEKCSAIHRLVKGMRTPVGLVICAHSRISIHNERVKLARCHSYQPVIKWVIITEYLCRRHSHHIHWHTICLCLCQCQCIHCHIHHITIITCHTFIVNRIHCPRNIIQQHNHWLPFLKPCIHVFEQT